MQAKLTGSEKKMMTAQPTTDTAAYELYHKGLSFWEKRSGDNIPKAIEFYQEAIARDPNYALAYAGLGSAYIIFLFSLAGTGSRLTAKAKSGTQSSSVWIPIWPKHTLASAKVLFFGEIDLLDRCVSIGARSRFKPNNASAHHWFSNDALAALGRFDEAIAEGKRAVELDPLSPVINADLGTTFYYAHRFDEAPPGNCERRSKSIQHSFTRVLISALFSKCTGDLAGAIAEYEKAKQLNDDPFMSVNVAQAKAHAGDKEAARRMLADLDKMSQSVRSSDTSARCSISA